VQGEALLDASAWIVGKQMLVGVVSREYVDLSSVVAIVLPASASSVDEILYGDSGWTVSGGVLSKTGLKGLEVGILVLNLT
jgi:hypothetical protein